MEGIDLRDFLRRFEDNFVLFLNLQFVQKRFREASSDELDSATWAEFFPTRL